MTSLDDFIIEASAIRVAGDPLRPAVTRWLIHGSDEEKVQFQIGVLLLEPGALGIDVKDGAKGFGLDQERVAMSAFAHVGVSDHRRRAIVTHIQGVAAGRLGALLMASSVLQGVETLGSVDDLVLMATLHGDTRALPFLDPEATPPAIILDARGRLHAFDHVSDEIVGEQQKRSRMHHPATRARTHLYAV